MTNNLLPKEVYSNLPDTLLNMFDLFVDREKDVIFLSSLSVLSSILPNIYGIYGGKKVYTNIYLMIIAPPASGKGSMNYTKGLINRIHKELYLESQEKRRRQKKNAIPHPLEVKVIPANISSAELYSLMNNSKTGNLILESEADTLSGMMKNDWGNFSDVLRKAFHHETLSISRKMDNLYFSIETPKLSLALSGTPLQLKPLITSVENGLFSRFTYYTFTSKNEWKDPFNQEFDMSLPFYELGNNEIYKLYKKLTLFKKEIRFNLTKSQKLKIVHEMGKINDISIKRGYSDHFLSNVRRHGLINYRLCMILSILRHKPITDETAQIECLDVDFNNALIITKTLLRHTLKVFNSLKSESILPELELNLINSMSETFTRTKFINSNSDLSTRTLDKKLVRWQKLNIITKVKHGEYRKI